MEERISSLEEDQFRGFPPSQTRPKSILKPTPSSSRSEKPLPTTSSSQASVEFLSPVVQPAPAQFIPEGWKRFKDGMSLGKETGSVVFTDGTLFGPRSVDVDLDSFEVPV